MMLYKRLSRLCQLNEICIQGIDEAVTWIFDVVSPKITESKLLIESLYWFEIDEDENSSFSLLRYIIDWLMRLNPLNIFSLTHKADISFWYMTKIVKLLWFGMKFSFLDNFLPDNFNIKTFDENNNYLNDIPCAYLEMEYSFDDIVLYAIEYLALIKNLTLNNIYTMNSEYQVFRSISSSCRSIF